MLSLFLTASLLFLTVEQRFALDMLADAGFRGDSTGMELARKRFADALPADAARTHYHLAFSYWMDAMASSGEAARSQEATKRAAAAVEKAIALDPSFVPAYVLRNRLVYMLSMQGVLKPEDAFRQMRETYDAAKKLAPDDPLVKTVEATFLYYTPGVEDGKEKGRAIFRKSIQALTDRNDPDTDLWLPILWNWYGTMYLGEGDMDKARAAFESALVVRPDYAWVRTAMLPMTDFVESGAAPVFPSTGWTTLLSDDAGDGRIPNLPDLRNVAWRIDNASDRVWFRLSLAAAPDPARFGVNLALDVDGDAANGRNWWAGNTAFRYDRVVTVWVVRSSDGRYRGSVGMADAPDAAMGRYVTSPAGTVTFAVDAEQQALLVGVPRKALGARDAMRVVATVGSNTDWNDTAPAEGAATLTLR